MGLMHTHQLDTLYKSYGSRNSAGVIWGHRGQKVIFTKIAISPSYYMVYMGLMNIHQLDTLYKSYGSRNSPEEKVNFIKNAITCPSPRVTPT